MPLSDKQISRMKLASSFWPALGDLSAAPMARDAMPRNLTKRPAKDQDPDLSSMDTRAVADAVLKMFASMPEVQELVMQGLNDSDYEDQDDDEDNEMPPRGSNGDVEPAENLWNKAEDPEDVRRKQP